MTGRALPAGPVFFIILASLSFACMGLAVKGAAELTVFQTTLFRSLVNLGIILVPMIKKAAGGPGAELFWGRRGNRRFLMLRAVCGLLGVGALFYALPRMPIGDSSALSRLHPFFITLLAALFLKEKITPPRILALIIGFAGALFILKPRFDFSLLPGLLCFSASLWTAGAYTALHCLGGREAPETPVFWFAGLTILVTLIPALAFWVSPSPAGWACLLAAGGFAALSQFCITRAYQGAPAGAISVFEYTHILFSLLLGWFLLGETPDLWSLLGSLMIIGMGVFLFLQGRRP
ncbi:MAG: DMT family transporter [Spirochaetales bacterium]|jgi:drug/metabolite transporter (DMT)-like permease|nr:DMT family transporter [Spirochaetales bacterium]